jgi:hypothetical protein
MSGKRAISGILLFFAGLFIIVAVLQYAFIRHRINATVNEQLVNQAGRVEEIFERNKRLDLGTLRRAVPQASRFIILGPDATFIDVHGFVRGTVTYADLPAGLTYDKPFVMKSSLGEEWHLFARKVKGGLVIVGASGFESTPDIDERLIETSKRFGDTFETALFPDFGFEDATVNYAVLDDNGILWSDYGGIPLKTKKSPLVLGAGNPSITVAGRPYFFLKEPIMDEARHQIGTIVVLTEVTLEGKLLHDILMFNIAVAVVCLLLCGVLFVIEFRQGESDTTH